MHIDISNLVLNHAGQINLLIQIISYVATMAFAYTFFRVNTAIADGAIWIMAAAVTVISLEAGMVMAKNQSDLVTTMIIFRALTTGMITYIFLYLVVDTENLEFLLGKAPCSTSLVIVIGLGLVVLMIAFFQTSLNLNPIAKLMLLVEITLIVYISWLKFRTLSLIELPGYRLVTEIQYISVQALTAVMMITSVNLIWKLMGLATAITYMTVISRIETCYSLKVEANAVSHIVTNQNI